MDGNDLGMIARVFMFLLKGLKYVLKLVWFTGLWWFCVPLVVGIGYEEITGTFIQNNQIIGTEPNYKELAGRKGQVGYLQRQGEKRTAKQN